MSSGGVPAQAPHPKGCGRGNPSITQASPSSKLSMRGTTSLYFFGTREVQRSPGSFRCPSAEMSLYCRFSAVAICERYRHGNRPHGGCAMLDEVRHLELG